MPESFRNRIALVTGGASGIGRALCQELARRGASIVVADIQFEGAREVAGGINAAGGRAEAVYLDVTGEEEVRNLVDQTVLRWGRLDYIFNNAGIGVGGEVRDLALDHWRRAIDVNLWGVIYGSVGAYRVMLGQTSGHIVNIASLAGLIGEPGLTPYSMTKSAVVALSTALRAEGEAFGVRVSVVCPGFIQTGIFDNAIGVNIDKEEFLAKLPFRLVQPDLAARKILDGVARNQAFIVFPFYAKVLWWLVRISPGALAKFHRRTLRELRAMRAVAK